MVEEETGSPFPSSFQMRDSGRLLLQQLHSLMSVFAEYIHSLSIISESEDQTAEENKRERKVNHVKSGSKIIHDRHPGKSALPDIDRSTKNNTMPHVGQKKKRRLSTVP